MLEDINSMIQLPAMIIVVIISLALLWRILKNHIIRVFGLKGSWSWACRQMDKGSIVYGSTWSGTVKYKLDKENQRRIVWSFRKNLKDPKWENYPLPAWESANIFLNDFEYTSWATWRK